MFPPRVNAQPSVRRINLPEGPSQRHLDAPATLTRLSRCLMEKQEDLLCLVMRRITARGSERQMRLQDTFGVDIQNLLALWLFPKCFPVGIHYNWIFLERNLRAEWVLHLVWAWDKLGFWPVRARHDSLWCSVCHRSRSCDVPALVAIVSDLLAG